MLMDQNLRFSAAQAVTATAASTNTLDLLQGTTVITGSASFVTGTIGGTYIIGQNLSVFGMDFGVGRGMGTPRVVVTTGPTAPGAATSLQISFQGAADPGASNTIASLTFIPYYQTRAIPLASILASNRVASFDWPMREVNAAMPRFINLNYIVAGSNFTGLTLSADVTLGPDDSVNTLNKYPSNF